MVQFEMLEARELLSASPLAHTQKTHKPKPTLPNLVGTFSGTETEQKPTAGSPQSVTLNITNESTKGVVTGTLTFDGNSEAVTGHVNKKGKFVFKVATSTKAKVTINGSFDSTSNAMTGKYTTPKSKGVKATHGTFSASAITT